MNVKALVFVLLVFSVFLISCTRADTTGYTAYNQPQGQQQGQYVGGGCGVAPGADYEDTAVKALDTISSEL